MTFKERLESLKAKVNAKIGQESEASEIQEAQAFSAELDELAGDYDKVVQDNAKFKDTIVRMVSSQGNGETPPDDSTGSKPMTIEEAFAKVKEKSGGK